MLVLSCLVGLPGGTSQDFTPLVISVDPLLVSLEESPSENDTGTTWPHVRAIPVEVVLRATLSNVHLLVTALFGWCS